MLAGRILFGCTRISSFPWLGSGGKNSELLISRGLFYLWHKPHDNIWRSTNNADLFRVVRRLWANHMLQEHTLSPNGLLQIPDSVRSCSEQDVGMQWTYCKSRCVPSRLHEHDMSAVQIDSFSESLKEHQKALTGDGMTVMEKAMIEHNLQAASRLYNNIYFSELGQLLSVSEDKAEKIASRMIAEKRLVVSPPKPLFPPSILFYITQTNNDPWFVQDKTKHTSPCDMGFYLVIRGIFGFCSCHASIHKSRLFMSLLNSTEMLITSSDFHCELLSIELVSLHLNRNCMIIFILRRLKTCAEVKINLGLSRRTANMLAYQSVDFCAMASMQNLISM